MYTNWCMSAKPIVSIPHNIHAHRHRNSNNWKDGFTNTALIGRLKVTITVRRSSVHRNHRQAQQSKHQLYFSRIKTLESMRNDAHAAVCLVDLYVLLWVRPLQSEKEKLPQIPLSTKRRHHTFCCWPSYYYCILLLTARMRSDTSSARPVDLNNVGVFK